MYNVQSAFSIQNWSLIISHWSLNIPHHPKPHAHPFSQPDIIRQRDVRLEMQCEGRHVFAFEGQQFHFFDGRDVYRDALLYKPVDAFGESQNIAAQDAVQQVQLSGFVAIEGAVAAVVLLIEGHPVEQTVLELVVPNLYIVVVQVYVFDVVVVHRLPHAQAHVAVLEQQVDVVGALVETDDAGFALRHLVLYERVAVREALVAVVVVKKPRFAVRFFDHGGPEARNIIGKDRLIEAQFEVSDLRHKYNKNLSRHLHQVRRVKKRPSLLKLFCWALDN